MSVAERLKNLNSQIEMACARSGRDVKSVHVILVSKLQQLSQIKVAHGAGAVDFGENYVQEASEKIEQLHDLNLRWHFIGRLQSNKLRDIVGRFAIIHSVDREKLLGDIQNWAKKRNCTQDIFLQYNVAEEQSKAGATREDLKKLVARATGFDRLRVLGLMVMPPMVAVGGDSAEVVRPFFRVARETLAEIRGEASPEILRRHPLAQLSMGTSQDYTVAIEEGSTWIRVGTQVFGERPKV